MLQIEEWFRRPQRRVERKAATAEELARELTGVRVQPVQPAVTEQVSEPVAAQNEPEAEKKTESAAAEPQIALQDTPAETEELEQITQEIGVDVTDMIDMEKEDFLLKQIDEFRDKAKQLQQLMVNRETKARELEHTVAKQREKADRMDQVLQVRRGEADKIMRQVSQQINGMSEDVCREMTTFTDAVSREVGGLGQSLTHEISQSTERTRAAVETAAQQMIDQNTRSLEGLKEQLEQLGHLEQIGELSTEMNDKITTLRADIADRIHAEDVKCYRNIQASMDEQSRMLSEGDEKTREHIREQVDQLSTRMSGQSKLVKASLVFTILDFVGIVGILVYLLAF